MVATTTGTRGDSNFRQYPLRLNLDRTTFGTNHYENQSDASIRNESVLSCLSILEMRIGTDLSAFEVSHQKDARKRIEKLEESEQNAVGASFQFLVGRVETSPPVLVPVCPFLFAAISSLSE